MTYKQIFTSYDILKVVSAVDENSNPTVEITRNIIVLNTIVAISRLVVSTGFASAIGFVRSDKKYGSQKRVTF